MTDALKQARDALVRLMSDTTTMQDAADASKQARAARHEGARLALERAIDLCRQRIEPAVNMGAVLAMADVADALRAQLKELDQ